MSHEAKKTCLITGAAGGIGSALVKVFHGAGFHIIATDIVPRPKKLPCTQYIQADLARIVKDETYAQQTGALIRNELFSERLDALINNAAVQVLGCVEGLDRADWRLTLDVNLMAPFLLTQEFLPELEAAKGCVINIGSIHARLTKKHFVAYATSKAALSGMTRALAVELGARIRVNAIEPAAIETDMLKTGFAGNPQAYIRLGMCHPQQRIGQPTEVAELALALVEGGAKYLHGACLTLDGGISARLCDPD